MKKKLAVSLIVIAITMAGVQAYAATYLNSNIINIISEGVNSIKGRFITASNNELDSINEQFNKKIGEYASTKAEQVNKDLESHKNAEISRANQEIDNYYNNIVKEADTVFDSQTKLAKDSITTNVNNNILTIKNDISKELEKQLKDKIK